jgi:hypothetical protein
MKSIVDKVYESVGSHNTKEMAKAIKENFGDQGINDIKKQISEDKEKFIELYSAFDEKQEDYFSKFDYEGQLRGAVEMLLSSGIVRVEGFLFDDQIEEIKAFQDRLCHLTMPYSCTSGRISLGVPPNIDVFYSNWRDLMSVPPLDPRAIAFEELYPNDGQVRFQSKTFGDLHPPGATDIVEHLDFRKLFALYNNLQSVKICRSNMEYVSPAPINHNGWHRDVVPHQLKAMLLLEDVDEYAAPMLYAMGSHRMNKEFDKEHLYDMFVRDGKIYKKSREDWPEYAIKKPGSHCGYLDPNSAPNDIHPNNRLNNLPVTIGGSDYEMFVATGKAGDIILFDSCGLHSGTRACIETRRNITFSSVTSCSPKSSFFNLLNEHL